MPLCLHVGTREAIGTYIKNLEQHQSNSIEEIQNKPGLACTAGLRPSSTQHRTDMCIISSKIRSLNTLLNELAPISRLPTETLHLIMAFQASQFIEPFRLSLTSKVTIPPNLLELVNMTHVCRKWRAVALNDPTLWSQISPTQPMWALEMLARSRARPLSIMVDDSNLSHKGYEAARKLLGQMVRIRKLSLSILDPRFLHTELLQPAPKLRSFTIRIYDIRELGQELAQPLFQGIALKLRHMSLDRCKIPWDSHLFNGLTILRLANLDLRHDITPYQFLDVFRRIPKLHTLRIMDVEFDPRDLSYSSSEKVVLPNLKFLSLTGSASVCCFFWKHVDLPKNPFPYLVFDLRREQSDQTPVSIVDSFTQLLTNMEQPLRHLTIECLSKSSLRLEGSLTAYENQQDVPRSHFTFQISNAIYQEMDQLIPELPFAFLSRVPVGHLHTILLTGWGVCSACRSGVDALASVTSIILHGLSAEEWVAHMNSPAGDGALPALRSIIFEGIGFSTFTSPLCRTLVAFLRLERKGCARIEVLQFRKCIDLEPEQVECLQRHVVEIAEYETLSSRRHQVDYN